MKLNYYKLISDEEYMPKLKVLNSIEYSGDRWELTDIYELAPVFSELTDVRREFAENVYMVTYGYDNSINGIHHISTGHLTRAEIPIRIIITHIVLSNAYGFKIFHNHPFDDVNDSEDDRKCSDLFKDIARHLECDYMGHYIVTKNRCRCIETNDEYEFEEDDY